jgi:hypothetical protein
MKNSNETIGNRTPTTFITIYHSPNHAEYLSHFPSSDQLNFTRRNTLSRMAEIADDMSGKAIKQMRN